MNKGSTEGFEGSENTLYDIIMMDTCHYTFDLTHRMWDTKGEPLCKLWTLGDDRPMEAHQL